MALKQRLEGRNIEFLGAKCFARSPIMLSGLFAIFGATRELHDTELG